jgi:hypothetical protein
MAFSVPRAKIVDYLLKEPGKRKLFAVFGYSAKNWDQLQRDILELATKQAEAMTLRQETQYGREYEIIGEVETPGGRSLMLTTAWFLDAGETEIIRFVTAYPA